MLQTKHDRGDAPEIFTDLDGNPANWPGHGVGYSPWSPPVAESCAFEAEDHNYWVPQGYVVVVVDARGSWRSPGEGGAVGRDMYDAIEWAGEQEWSNGNVGLSGVSALSIYQYNVTRLDPPHLKAICPWEGSPFGYVRHGGVGPQTSPPIFQIFTPPHEPAWDAPSDTNPPEGMDRTEDELFEQVTQPALICGSWSSHGLFGRGDFRAFRQISSEHKWLYNHGREKWASFYETEAQAFRKLFFDHFLKGTDDRILDVPPVRVEVRDTLRNWSVHGEDDFPIPRTEYRRLYLDAEGGELVDEAPEDESEVSYDSTEPESGIFEFTFQEDTALIGYQSLKLWITPEDASDADLFVTVRKLDRDGDEVEFTGYGAPLHYPVALGWLRLSERELDKEKSTDWEPYLSYGDSPDEVDPGDPVECHVPILPSGTWFSEGETLQVEVSGSFLGQEELEVTYPAEEKGQTPFEWESVNEGEHTIHTGGDYGSYLVIPEVPPEDDVPGRGPPSENQGRGSPSRTSD
ncbi:CocE/NonD family hydrolase [Halobellus rufus]|uniref:CocE/NonD family hydrolase n=1 Tax=Halobellus rufus TaxID=1448860 RepID=UPI0009E0AC6A|nr:CocE/NonD family hydrolase [Halobellus rufus]